MLLCTHDMPPKRALTTILHTAINYLLLYQLLRINKSLSRKKLPNICKTFCKILRKFFSVSQQRKRILLFLVELCNVCYMYWREVYV